MEEMMREETTMETETEVMPVTDSEESTGSSMVVKAVIVGVCGLVAGAAAFGAKKLKQRNRQKTIEKLREEGWIVEEPVDSDAEVVDGDVVSEEEVPEETEE